MGYHNIKIEEKDCNITSFDLPWGQNEYTRIPFGLKTAPRYFQSVMSRILSDLPYVRVFLDDILVFSNSVEEHLIYLKEVLSRLKSNCVSINFEKSNFI